jgi:poly(ribitol-phosphate) beta-N-acetylglucosaminyltransferase
VTGPAAHPPLKVSVVIPVYNPGEHIHPCIDGLLAQTMPANDLEAIFVDDGSTDTTPALLDSLAEAHEHIRVIHQPNSGWPGKPRNVGIDAARGEFIFFCDNDDWLGAEALERMYAFAMEHDADVLIGKMAGLNRKVPQDLFRKTKPRASLADTPLMDSMTPHKLFRKEFLNRHGIRFPEGRRRLEDHYFVVKAYLLARNVSIYADYTCYYHIRRSDESNAAFDTIDWGGYFGNLREAIEVVVAHTEPGPRRDEIFRRWLHVEMVMRFSGERFLSLPPRERGALFAAAHETAAAHFGPSVVALLPPVARPVALHLLEGDLDGLIGRAALQARWRAQAELDQYAWEGDLLAVEGRASLAVITSAGPDASDEAIRELLSTADVEPETAIRSASLGMYVLERASGERWPVPITSEREGLSWTFSARVDVDRLAAGAPLRPGRWDLHVEAIALGLRRSRRLELKGELPDGGRAQLTRDRPGGSVPIAAYFTKGRPGLTIAIGEGYPPPRPKPPKPSKPPMPRRRRSLPRRVLGRLRRILSGSSTR